MKPKLIQQGAEAKIFLEENFVVKDRVVKGYRLKELDEAIRKRRTKKEERILEKAAKLINVPKVFSSKDRFSIKMEFVDGKKLSENLDELSEKDAEKVCVKIGENVAKLHDAGIIHGDLTTSNMIWVDADNKLFFIDFGLSYENGKIEDKAVDLHLLKQALEAKHFGRFDNYLKWIFEGYEKSQNSKDVLERLKKVESRGRYKEKY